MILVWACILVLAGSCCVAGEERSRIVHTAQGPVRGHRHPQGKFFAFYSIPYATGPSGPNRFKPPLPPPSWTETYDALEKNIICPQNDFFVKTYGMNDSLEMKEDCLLANVFVPDTKEKNLPVVVYVHGSGFQVGYGHLIIHAPLIDSGKIIEVNFNYRLGPHGFLCLGTEDIPGNAGMKDMVAALRWVKRNIANFGGNPNDVTLAGYSAGAASVELLMLSKSTRGLFNKVIPESGSAVSVWAVQTDPLEIANWYARSLGFETAGDVHDLEDFFKNQPLDVLQSSYKFLESYDSTLYFAPCVERENAEEPFLIDAPVNIIKNGDYPKLPMLMGFSDMEGIIKLPMFDEWKDAMNKEFSEFLPADLSFSNDDERQKIAQKVKEVYFSDRPVSAETAVGYVNYFTDVMFAYSTYRSVALQAAAGSDSLYLYVYAFVDNRTSIPYPDVTGADHCDQSAALGLSTFLGTTNESERFKKMKQLLADVWKNFILNGEPTPEGSLAASVFGSEWQPARSGRPRHALFNGTSEVRAELWPHRMTLWDGIYSDYYRTPVPPPQAPTKRLNMEL